MAAILDGLKKFEEPETRNTDFSQTDQQLTRNRGARMGVTFATPPLFLTAGYILGVTFAAFFRLPLVVGYTIGLGLGGYASVWAFSRSFIENGATQAFITVNQLASLLDLDSLVYYGPGKHFCYWWESRGNGSTVTLVESAESFDLEVQVKDGKVKYKVSFRYRPHITKLHEYVSGVAGIGSEVVGLLKSTISEMVSLKKVTKAASQYEELNALLKKTFQHGSTEVSPFEERFGIIMGDATIEGATTDVENTIKTISENAIIDKATASSFGYTTMKQLMENVGPEKKYSLEEVNHRRDRIQASSGNLEGMQLNENRNTHNVNIQGLGDLQPEVAEALGKGLTLAAGAFGGSSKGKPDTRRPRKPKGGKQ